MSVITPISERVLGPVARAGGRGAKRLNVSFEFFPPKTDEAEEKLWGCVRRLEPLGPKFVSVTYGAGGSTRERTHRAIGRILAETGLAPAAHLTCVGAAKDEVDAVIEDYWSMGVRHVVALRGDPPEGMGAAYRPKPDEYANATELTAAIKRLRPGMEVSVGLYPEKHPESPSLEHDIAVLRAKVEAGADRAITQFFFDVDAFLRFADRVREAGIIVPIVPGIMPVTNYKGLVRMAGACNTRVPPWLANLFDGLDDVPETRRPIAGSIAAEMCARLEEEGYADFHFYTLNRADLVYAICRVLGVRETPVESRAEAAA